MMEINEKFNISVLLSIYGAMLTSHQEEMMRLYYDCDISLFEISEQFNISRQAVRDAIVRGEKTLRDIELKLKLKEKIDIAQTDLRDVQSSLLKGESDDALKKLDKLIAALEENYGI